MAKPAVLSEDIVRRATVPSGATRSGKPRKDAVVRDAEVTGFCLRVTAAGTRTFFAEYTAPTGKRRVRIGEWGQLTVKQARAKARAVLGAAASGSDPFAERRAAEAAERARVAGEAYTFGKLIHAWERGRADQGRRASYLTIAVRAMRSHLGDWLDRAANSIGPVEAVQRLDFVKEAAGPTAANRLLSYARAAYGWAIARQLLTTNPFAGLEAPGATVPRDRVLNATELGAIWRATDTLPPTPRGFIRVLLLTLGRRDEVAAIRWDELSSDIWTLPAARSKNGKAHVVHLSAPVCDILAAQARIAGCPLVFPGDGLRGPIRGFSYIKRRLDAVIAAAAPDEGEQRAMPGWTFHDFRRSGVTALAGMGFAPHVCDRLLNHVGGSISGVAAVYQRHEFLTERKAALDAWAAHVLAAANGRAAGGNTRPRPVEPAGGRHVAA
jgi:integrase